MKGKNERVKKEAIDLEKQESILYIKQLLEKQEKLEELNQAVRDVSASLDKAQKALETYKVRVKEESAAVVKNQRDLLENHLEKEVELASRTVEQAEKKRAQEKEKQRKYHIADATQDYKERIREAKRQIKRDMKANKIPVYCSKGIWFSLFMPTFFTDYLKIIIVWLLTGLGLPFAIYMLIPKHAVWQFYILFPLFLILTIVLHAEIYRRVVKNHRDVLAGCREQMNLIHELKGRIRKTEKKIIKSDDESLYELQELDEKIEAARRELNEARAHQSESLKEFEQHTRLEIIEEFRQKAQEKFEELTAAINSLSREKNLTLEMVSELQLELVDQYEEKIGAENMNPVRLKEILQKLEGGMANTLEEALGESGQ